MHLRDKLIVEDMEFLKEIGFIPCGSDPSPWFRLDDVVNCRLRAIAWEFDFGIHANTKMLKSIRIGRVRSKFNLMLRGALNSYLILAQQYTDDARVCLKPHTSTAESRMILAGNILRGMQKILTSTVIK